MAEKPFKKTSNVSGRLQLRRVVRVIEAGAVVAYPTEAVFGLGCDPWNEVAVRCVLALKQRPEHKGLILIAADIGQLRSFLAPLPPGLRREVEATWPGPVTWVLKAAPGVPRWLRGRHRGIAVRVTAHPIAAELCRQYGGALVSTSANRAGRPPCRDAVCVRRVFGNELAAIVNGPVGGDPRPTRIIDGVGGRVLRA